jgi:hypothetical protein
MNDINQLQQKIIDIQQWKNNIEDYLDLDGYMDYEDLKQNLDKLQKIIEEKPNN